MTEIESFSVIPFSASPLQNLKGFIMFPGQLIKADLKLINFTASFHRANKFCTKDPQTVSGWMWEMEVTNTIERIGLAKVPIWRFCLY